jgi:hypothetical protein
MMLPHPRSGTDIISGASCAQFLVKPVKGDARFDQREALLRIDVEDAVHPAQVEHDAAADGGADPP